MPRFFIEVPHEAEVVACALVVESFLNYGSHFATQADWGCQDGEHKAWIVSKARNKEEARNILPPAFQAQTKIVQLNKFSMEDIAAILEVHRH